MLFHDFRVDQPRDSTRGECAASVFSVAVVSSNTFCAPTLAKKRRCGSSVKANGGEDCCRCRQHERSGHGLGTCSQHQVGGAGSAASNSLVPRAQCFHRHGRTGREVSLGKESVPHSGKTRASSRKSARKRKKETPEAKESKQEQAGEERDRKAFVVELWQLAERSTTKVERRGHRLVLEHIAATLLDPSRLCGCLPLVSKQVHLL